MDLYINSLTMLVKESMIFFLEVRPGEIEKVPWDSHAFRPIPERVLQDSKVYPSVVEWNENLPERIPHKVVVYKQDGATTLLNIRL